MSQLHKIAIVVNSKKNNSLELSSELIQVAKAAGIETIVTNEYPIPKGFLKGVDLCCTMGGDGTILGVMDEALNENVPILGINLGKLGFLATFSASEALARFPAIFKGNYQCSQRSLLKCTDSKGQKVIALNDLAIKSNSSKLVRIEVFADGHPVNEYYADGLLVCTPTGSTAYNLSAYGPILHPHAPAIAMTPICPHTLSNRSVIFGDSTELEIDIKSNRSEVSIKTDGKSSYEKSIQFPIKIKKSNRVIELVCHPNRSHFDVMRDKLHWGRENE